MWENIIEYFSKRHLLTNFMLVIVISGGIFLWHQTGKEELPEITADRVIIKVSYPGAAPDEVEHFVTRPIEDELKGVDGIYRMTSTTSMGMSAITVEIDRDYPDVDEVLTDIRNTVLDVDLPDDITEDPFIRQFKSSKKAIVDICLYDESEHILDYRSRHRVQALAHALENRLQALPQINSVSKSGYYQEELQVRFRPEMLERYELPLSTIMDEIRKNSVRRPAGSLETLREEKVTVDAEIDSVPEMKNLIVKGGFAGSFVRVGQVADVRMGYERYTSIFKINGHEGIRLNAVKNSSYGILVSMDAVTRTVNSFRESALKDTDIRVVLLDDESRDVRNRLSLIGMNGAIGFILILTMLFVFLNFRSGLWVALGIPFTFCFTMIFAWLLGYTINNMTLAAVIIVMGMVVDDAIVVAENISRLRGEGMDMKEAAIKGTSYVFLPVAASVLTTCVAFLPMFSFTGRISHMSKAIPPIISIMLLASLLESILILPSHMGLRIPRAVRVIFSLGTLPLIERRFPPAGGNNQSRHWFHAVEDRYGRMLETVLRHRAALMGIFIALLALSAFLFTTRMKFVMFPREEASEVFLVAEAPVGTSRLETARLSKPLDKIFLPYIGTDLIGFRTSIAVSRHGGAVEENNLRMRIELRQKEKRQKPLRVLMKEWEQKVKKVPGFSKIYFSKMWFGQTSGSPIEIIVQESNDRTRADVAEKIASEMKKIPALKNVEIESPMKNPEYRIDLKRDLVRRLGINPATIGSTLRAAVEGSILYELASGDEEIHVRLSASTRSRDSIRKVLNIPVENSSGYLVPLSTVVNVRKVMAPNSITRRDAQRTVYVYADMKEKADQTPLEVAERIEETIFPGINSRFPTTSIFFGGEVEDTRESGSDLRTAIILVVVLIYFILALMFNSLFRPFIIMLAIPFGAVGVILAFQAHGMNLFGFFSAVGTLGLAGVVVNDSIVMVTKLDREGGGHMTNTEIANVAKTRLRAVVLTTLTTVAGLLPTAYGFAGYDSMLAEMMLAMAWGLLFGTLITLLLVPALYSVGRDMRQWRSRITTLTQREHN